MQDLVQLCENIQLQIAMAADENDVSDVDTLNEWTIRLEDAIYWGLESAEERALKNE